MTILGVAFLKGEGSQTNPTEGERWLRRSADAGDVVGMRILGARLLDGTGLPANTAEAVRWLVKAAEAGEPSAMMLLGISLLEGDKLPADAAEGERWLRKAADAGDARAMASLGDRLLEGRGLAADAAEGERWLRKAADAGFAPAMARLGMCLLDGDKLHCDVAGGERWLRKALEAGDALAAVVLGFRTYSSGDLTSAADLFRRGYELGGTASGVNLAYMKRRAEVPMEMRLPLIVDLLSKGITEKSVVALLNYALCLACGVECSINWDSADQTVASITACEEVDEALKWWHNRAAKQDPEGHFVLGMLARHGLVCDPDGWTVAQRMQAARAGGWGVPDSLCSGVA